MSDNGAPQGQVIPHQSEMPVIRHEVRNELIDQRAVDGYINATAMCQAAGRPWSRYRDTGPTKRFVDALSTDIGIPISELIQTLIGGTPELQGTWVHPQVAIHLAQWLSPEFAVQVSRWVFEWIGGHAERRGRLPDHVRRYLVNRPKIPPSHFSMLDQMTLRLLAPLEEHGYTLPARLMPDIALGRMFSRWLRDRGYDPDSFPTYDHQFLDHRPVVRARLYPNELLTAFNLQLDAWLRDGSARKYFGGRDATAIEPLSRVLAALPAPNRTPAPGEKQSRERPEVRVKPHTYQPSKAELDEPMKIDATPDELARAVLTQVKVVQDEDA